MPSKTNPDYARHNSALRRPEWLKVRLGAGDSFVQVRQTVKVHHLHTVCESAHCPNLGECWSRGTATFMLLGNICTRSCTFCNVQVGRPAIVDQEEPRRVAEAVKKMNLHHAVLTMVARDDLPDSGARIIAECITWIRKLTSGCTVEALISDLKGRQDDLDIILQSRPDILNHNLETVKRLQKALRVQARYDRSLQILHWAREAGFITKSGIMVGVGEAVDEIIKTMKDLRNVDCQILTIGQYLPPTRQHFPLQRYYQPAEFTDLKELALEMGFIHVESGPLVRSSYHAEQALQV
jgi:lipoic acid synthetase